MPRSLGLDFGTTNTVLAQADADGHVTPIPFAFQDASLSALRSALCFWHDSRDGTAMEAGPWAIAHYLDDPGDRRFIQSLKTFAANPSFSGTVIYGKSHRFEDLLAAYFGRLLEHAGTRLETRPRRLVVGRPVRFAGGTPDAGLARERYEAALRRFGFDEIRFVYEPVAAAFFFAQRLEQDATVLVADFGGGTTDYSVMRFERVNGAIRAKPLSHSGVGIAGDSFDYRIIDHVVSPQLGKGTFYRSMGKTLEMPKSYYANFARWNLLSIMKTTKEFRDLKQLVRFSLDPKLLEQFVALIESEQGYSLYRAVSKTKEALSSVEETAFEFAVPGTRIKATVTRRAFEDWIEGDLHRIERALDEALAKAKVDAGQIDKVFLTGGTSFVPAVRRLFEDRFGAARIEAGDEHVSIAKGLALIGEQDDIAPWTAEAAD
jgi:hypothetical chaperone protein